MYDIDWTKIKNDSKGFEDLAREYVKDVFSFPIENGKKHPPRMMVIRMHILLL